MMKSTSRILLTLASTVSLVGSASAASLLGYYDFEGNYNDSSGNSNNAAPSQNPTELSFVPGFRGQALDINDPATADPNTGGSVDIPINGNPNVLAGVTFGGWVNIDNNGFDGFMAMDNGGWDRGITISDNISSPGFGAASGAGPVMAGTITQGAWQYVVGTFNQPGDVNIYVGDANPLTVTTLNNFGPDLNAAPWGLELIELGRYDNQDMDGKADDIFVFGDELNAHEVNSIRNLRLSALDFSPVLANELFELFDASGSGSVGGLDWSPTSGLSSTNPGEVFALGSSQWAVVLDDAGNGLLGVPEPTVPAILGLSGFLLLLRRRRR